MSEHEGIWLEYRPTYMDSWNGYKRMGDLVRCRDCEYYTPEFEYSEDTGFGVERLVEPGGCFNPARRPTRWDGVNNRYTVVGIDTQPDGFCSWGARKVEQ